MTRRKDLPPGASIGIVLLLWTAAVCAALAWVLAASVAPAQVVSCMSPAQMMLFLHTTGLPFEGVPGGIVVHAENGRVFYALTDGLYCLSKGSDA